MAAILKREDASDAWLSRDGSGIERIRHDAVIGTTSLRRKIQLQKKYPQFVFQNLRGNVDTRLKKLQLGTFDAIVLATSGLKRLGLADQITHTLDIVSAVGQGAIGVECRENDADIKNILSALNDSATELCVSLERHFLKKAEGSCQTPIGAFCQSKGKLYTMHCFLAKSDGSEYREEIFEGSFDQIKKCVDDF